MKTKINTLLGAVHSLLVTVSLTQAAPPQGGGGTGGGTIYYVGPWPGATQGGTAVMTKMNSDGSGKTPLALGMFGNPSWVLHNNRRWFVYTYVIPDQYYPDGIT